MTHQTLNQVIPAQQSTCANCPKFQDYQDRGRGLCQVFDKVVRKQHLFTSDCHTAIEAEELKELLSTYKAFLKPISKVMPGVNVYKQLPELGYERIGYVSENLVGWFAKNRHGLTVAERYKSQNEALKALLESFKPVEHSNYRAHEDTKSELDLDFDKPEEDTPHSEYEPGQIVKVIDEGEEHTEWADFVVIGKNYNQQRFRSTESYLTETNWYYLLASVDIPTQHQFWVAEDEICHAEYSHLIDTAEVF